MPRSPLPADWDFFGFPTIIFESLYRYELQREFLKANRTAGEFFVSLGAPRRNVKVAIDPSQIQYEPLDLLEWNTLPHQKQLETVKQHRTSVIAAREKDAATKAAAWTANLQRDDPDYFGHMTDGPLLRRLTNMKELIVETELGCEVFCLSFNKATTHQQLSAFLTKWLNRVKLPQGKIGGGARGKDYGVALFRLACLRMLRARLPHRTIIEQLKKEAVDFEGKPLRSRFHGSLLTDKLKRNLVQEARAAEKEILAAQHTK